MADSPENSQRVTNAEVRFALANLEKNMNDGFERIADGQKEEVAERKQ